MVILRNVKCIYNIKTVYYETTVDSHVVIERKQERKGQNIILNKKLKNKNEFILFKSELPI